MIFHGRRKIGRLDLEAIEMAVRSAMNHAGAALKTFCDLDDDVIGKVSAFVSFGACRAAARPRLVRCGPSLAQGEELLAQAAVFAIHLRRVALPQAVHLRHLMPPFLCFPHGQEG